MVERGQDFGLAFETSHPLRIAGKGFRQDFQRDFTVESGIGGPIDLPHATIADL